MKHFPSLVAATLSLFAIGSAKADTTLIYEVAGGGSMSMAVTDTHLRIDTGYDQWMLYEKSTDTMYMVQPSQRQYAKMNRDVIARMSAGINAEIDAAMAGLGPQESAMMEQMMGGKLPGKAAPKPKAQVIATGESAKVAGFACEIKDYRSPAGETSRICVAELDAIDVSDKEYATATAMSSLMLALASSLPFGGGDDIQDMAILGGIPLRSESDNGVVVQQVTAISHDDISAEQFQLPEGYAEQTM